MAGIPAGRIEAPQRRLRLGMVGGGIGALIGKVHRAAARLDDQFEFVAGCLSSTPERCRYSGVALGLAPERSYPTIEAMIAGEQGRPDRVDAVSIVTPNHLHFEQASAFLEAGFDVICDKPLTSTLGDAKRLAQLVESTGRVFVLTHNYTGYPMTRQARALVAEGALGPLRMVHVEYPQDWLATPLEREGVPQAEWRMDPERAGPGGCSGDIGTHAINIACFVTGLELDEISAELTAFVPGRALDDNVNALLRFRGGARGILWASQIASGNANGLRLRVYGETAGLSWMHLEPNYLELTPVGGPPERLARGSGRAASPGALRGTRLPDGCPEGFFEAFATIYSDAAELIRAKQEGRAPDPAAMLLPTVHDGVAGMSFVEAAVASSRRNGAWVKV
jgi:predicted dehydrogenase